VTRSTKGRNNFAKYRAQARGNRACEACGEDGKAHKLKLVMDGRLIGSWHVCAACAAVKTVALLGSRPLGLVAVRHHKP
jgi:hypothetical protein